VSEEKFSRLKGDEIFRRLLRERQVVAPLTFCRALTFAGVLHVPQTFPLFRAQDGQYDTVITMFKWLSADPFGTANLYRTGLLADGKPMDVWRDGCYDDTDAANQNGLFTAGYRGNGMLPAGILSLPAFSFNFMYVAKPGQQISVVGENFRSGAAVPMDVNIFLAGAVMT
jgi:hypothetical protein